MIIGTFLISLKILHFFFYSSGENSMLTMFLVLCVVVSLTVALVLATITSPENKSYQSWIVVSGFYAGLTILWLIASRGSLGYLFGSMFITSPEQIRGLLLGWAGKLKNYKHNIRYQTQTPVGRTSHSVLYNTGISGKVGITLRVGDKGLSGILNLEDFKPHRKVDFPYSMGDMAAIDAKGREAGKDKNETGRNSEYELRWSSMPVKFLIPELAYNIAYVHLKALTGQLGSIESNMRGFSWRYFHMRVNHSVWYVDSGFLKYRGDITNSLLKASYIQFTRDIRLGSSQTGKPPKAKDWGKPVQKETGPDLSAFMQAFGDNEEILEIE